MNGLKLLLLALFAGIIAWVGFTAIISIKQPKNKRGKNGGQQKVGSHQLIDYSTYSMTIKEKLGYSLLAGTILYLIGYIFYHHDVVSLVFSVLGLYYPAVKKKALIEKQKKELVLQFKQALYSLSSALAAGKSVENAFLAVAQDLKMLYPDPQANIIREFEIINHRIENGEPLEQALIDFSNRADIEDITNFADVFTTSKRTGGDLVEIIRKTSNMISEKLEVQQEIEVLLAQKKLEAKILSIAPFIMVAVIRFTSPDYMEPLYKMGVGPIIMTIALVFLGFSYWLTNKIMRIKV